MGSVEVEESVDNRRCQREAKRKADIGLSLDGRSFVLSLVLVRCMGGQGVCDDDGACLVFDMKGLSKRVE